MKKYIASLLLPLVLLVLGCATIVGKTTQVVSLSSAPDQADVVIIDENKKDIFKGKTPTTVTLKKGDGYFHGKDYTVTISKEGFSDRTVKIESKPSGWYIAGNILFGGLIGWFIVDPATGAMWTLIPEKVDETLKAESAQSSLQTLHIVLLEDVPFHLKSKMVPLN